MRLVGLGSIALVCGCGLVSGLDNLEVRDGSAFDASSDQPQASDVVVLPDIQQPPLEAGTGGYALHTTGGCASGPNVSLSNFAFTVTLWLRIDSASSDNLPVVWNGGRGPSEQGWSLDLTTQGLTFCVSDQNGFTCTPGYAIPAGHLVHIGVLSPYNQQTSGRTLTMYAMDSTAGATTHTQVSTVSGAQGNWTSSASLTIGGALVGTSCNATSMVTVDRLHIQTSVLQISSLDAAAKGNACTQAAYDFEFDEGTGAHTADCTQTATALNWAPGAKVSFVISPFP